MIKKVKKKYLTQFIWIVMGWCVRDGGNVCVSKVNIGFKLFHRGVNGSVCLSCCWFSKA